MNDLSHNRPYKDLAALLALAVVYRLLFLAAMPRVLDNADAIHYLEAAAHFAEGRFFAHDPKIPLLYPLLAGAAHGIIPDLEWAARAVSFLASVLLLVPVYLLARDLHGPSAARVAGVVVAIWPWLADYGWHVATEATASLWWFLAVWLFARGMRRGGWWLAGGVASFIALHFTRPEGAFLLLTAPLAGVLLCAGRDNRALWRLAPVGGAIAALLLANAWYNHQLAGVATANVRIGYIVQEFDYLRFAHTAVNTLSEVFPIMLGPVLLLFLGVGFFHPRRTARDARLEAYVLLFAAVQWAVSLFVLSPAPRYLMNPIIALSLWSACGVVLAARLAARRPRPWGRVLRILPAAAVVAFMLLHTAVTLGSEHLERRPRMPREYKDAGLWMRENLEAGLIFTRKPQIAWYAGMPSTGPADDDGVDEAIARARAAGAAYFVVDERYAPPALLPLLDPEAAPETLRHLHAENRYPQSRVAIYALETE